ncbi:MAG: hypothetical protein A3A80_02885 [Candidatus Terrybacteria bacterium RIFCSPLOWO2_01_FULL_44_24]|uniref:Haloacid dehalogenase n=1 Tax=Candidatus Terrybacteria bacterium RIFCSPHIGHO2_01_FULL_43_35 TaxID=1802361 RepID=A0A1G2PGY6_9BACT|nr:MAG: hypothetical protein A2828_03070 [Candidatus Terrybacteria bacterium RIFCSPHIGHO2_01_FULL_43_35]OHA50237.1 MAG: hypothetical protein A3B75_00325 [Candidatus Terrybacteria bacterium RIFCSPHIGHO2_02_FULL_43_14]OHA51012.1 MAG: hypothetical protein A3A80_02885 [Candidatus Terrybacteria bacterium RIFCSPLOWO2_01_FULL_44_24]
MEKFEQEKSKVKLLCFDVNGTLLDDTALFLNAINGVFGKFNKPLLPLNILKERFGQPWTKIYREEGIAPEMASEEQLYGLYNELYAQQPKPEPFDDLKPTLEWLKDKSVILAIVSTQQNNITLPLLKHYGLYNFFSHFEGGVSDKAHALGSAFNHFGFRAKETAYVGDQERDIMHAKNAGCISVGFCGGLHNFKRLSAAKPSFLIRNHSEIKNLPIFD